MSETHRVQGEFAGRTLTIETGKLAKLCNASVTVQLGESIAFVAATAQTMDRDPGFFPLTVDYREKMLAAGKFPGGFLKREGRPTTKEILTCRLIDRPIRPLFPDGLGNEVQVMAMVLSADDENDPDILGVIGAMAALHISDIPWDGPLGATRVCMLPVDDSDEVELVSFPTVEERKEAICELVIAGSRDSTVMVEAGAEEVTEDEFIDTLEFGQAEIQKVIDLIEQLRKATGDQGKFEFTPPVVNEAVVKLVDEKFRKSMQDALTIQTKKDRGTAASKVKKEIIATLCPDDLPEGKEPEHDIKDVKAAIDALKRSILRGMIVKDKKRIDGRGLADIRPIECEVGLLPRVHGSAVFTRGETQAVVSVALGTTYDEQRVDGLMAEYKERFYLHYQFPPFSVGECRFIRGPGRREIGHGRLAQRALECVIPDADAFPYTIRVNSDIMESNGSSSMASVCGGTLAMMDAGVPIGRPVAGIAMGLVKEGDEIRVLSDILGAEDKDGDMDFKVTGTDRGITALQLDCKVAGISRKVMEDALEQARQGRLHILKEMLSTIDRPNRTLSKYAPRVIRTRIPPDKIGIVIGPGGKQIRKIQEDTGAEIAIEEDGVVTIYCVEPKGAEGALNMVKGLTATPEVGALYSGRVTSIKDFGAFVEILPNQEGLCHISELADGFVENVRDVVSEGDTITVKVLAVDDQGRVKLSKKAADANGADGSGEGAGAGSEKKPRKAGK